MQNVVQPNGISARVEEESKFSNIPPWLPLTILHLTLILFTLPMHNLTQQN